MSKMRIALLAAVLIPFALPTDVAAQGRERFGGAKGAEWDKVASKKPTGITLSGGDLEKLSPLKMFISKKKDLKLTDEQVASLTEANAKLMDGNAEHFEHVDTHRKTLNAGSSSNPSADDMARSAIAKDELMKSVSSVRTSYDGATKVAVENLTAEQQATAAKLLEKHDEEVQKVLGDKLGSVGRAGPGRRR